MQSRQEEPCTIANYMEVGNSGTLHDAYGLPLNLDRLHTSNLGLRLKFAALIKGKKPLPAGVGDLHH